jgi:uncharacterized integral membrane protein
MRTSALFWGSLLVIIGLLFMLSNLNIVTINIWNLIWPLFLIALGVWTLWGNSLGRRLESERVVIPRDDAQRARVRVQHGAGRLEVRAGGDGGNLVEGSFGGGLDYHTRREGDLLDVRMASPVRIFPFFWTPGWNLNWSFGLHRDVILALDFETGANESRIDLTDLKVTDLRLQSGASSTDLILPADAGYTRVHIETGAASFNIHVPIGVAARVKVGGALSSVNVDRTRFPKQGGFYQSSDYDSAANKTDIVVQIGVGSVTVS